MIGSVLAVDGTTGVHLEAADEGQLLFWFAIADAAAQLVTLVEIARMVQDDNYAQKAYRAYSAAARLRVVNGLATRLIGALAKEMRG